MKMLLKLKRSWGAIRWKMLIIFVFFSVISMILVGCFAVAVLNVVIRRESAYLIEERIKVVVDERKELIDSVKGGVHACPESRSNSLQPIGHLDGVWPENPGYGVALEGVRQIRTCLARYRRFCRRRRRPGPS